MTDKDKEIEKLAEETPIQKAINCFLELKDKSISMRDTVYLDGVLAVLESIKPFEQDFITSLKAKYTEEEFKQGCYEAWVDRYSDDLEREPEGFDKWYESYLKSLEK